MTFIVTRTSHFGNETAPCEEARREAVGVTYSTLRGDVRGNELVWTVEIGSLEDLLSFSSRHGRIVITADVPFTGLPRVEIYDDYRE